MYRTVPIMVHLLYLRLYLSIVTMRSLNSSIKQQHHQMLLPTVSGSSITLDTDTVTSASPYIFNCSLRSVYGMCGLHADGSKADGFKSMVVAQFTGVSLQKDDNAFVKYNSTTGTFDDGTTVDNIHSDSDATYKPTYYNYHIKASNNSVCQLVSCFILVTLNTL